MSYILFFFMYKEEVYILLLACSVTTLLFPPLFPQCNMISVDPSNNWDTPLPYFPLPLPPPPPSLGNIKLEKLSACL